MDGKLVLMIELNAAFMAGIAWWADQPLRKLKTVAKAAAQKAAGNKIDVRAMYQNPCEFGTDEMFGLFPRLYAEKDDWMELQWQEMRKYGVAAPGTVEKEVSKAIRTSVLELERGDHAR